VLHLEVVTPQALVVEADVVAVIAPLLDGWRGILPGHAPFQARLMRGELLFRTGSAERTVATLGGVLATDGRRVTVLTGAAAADTDLITLERAIDEEIQRLQAAELEAEKHFGRVYRHLARAFGNPRRP
jgi:F-type H+-transporting ATPase subunit epsilon